MKYLRACCKNCLIGPWETAIKINWASLVFLGFKLCSFCTFGALPLSLLATPCQTVTNWFPSLLPVLPHRLELKSQRDPLRSVACWVSWCTRSASKRAEVSSRNHGRPTMAPRLWCDIHVCAAKWGSKAFHHLTNATGSLYIITSVHFTGELPFNQKSGEWCPQPHPQILCC